MASSSQEIKDADRPILDIQFGDLPPDILTILKNQTPAAPENKDSGQSHETQSSKTALIQSPPCRPPQLSPQLRFSRMTKDPKPPRTRLRLSRTVASLPPPLPPTFAQTTNRSYVAVPSKWSVDRRLESRDTYLSRDPLIRKMFQRRLLCRKFLPIPELGEDEEKLFRCGVEILGRPEDYWLTFPLQPPNRLERVRPPPFDPEDVSPEEEVVHAWATGPVKYSRDKLDNMAVTGSKLVGTRAHPWVTNVTGTKMLSLESMISHEIEKIVGFEECPKCGDIFGIRHRLPLRFTFVRGFVVHNENEILDKAVEVLQCSHLDCYCDENGVSTRPIINEDWRKINWLFLFFGPGLGYCTSDQLRYFCRQRGLATSGSKNRLVRRVLVDIARQLQGYRWPCT